ncbi:MAG: TlpA family protein disulfide reductase [Massilia sp.]
MLSTASCSRRLVAGSLFALAVVTSAPLQAADMLFRPWPDKLPVPPLRLVDLNGQEWTLDSLRGKVVLLNFWASWCGPCVDELPVLNELAGSPAGGGDLIVLGVNYKESADAIARFAQAHPFRYPILRDKSGDAFKAWTNGVMPTTVLIDRNGRARWRVIGELSPGDQRFGRELGRMLQKTSALPTATKMHD